MLDSFICMFYICLIIVCCCWLFFLYIKKWIILFWIYFHEFCIHFSMCTLFTFGTCVSFEINFLFIRSLLIFCNYTFCMFQYLFYMLLVCVYKCCVHDWNIVRDHSLFSLSEFFYVVYVVVFSLHSKIVCLCNWCASEILYISKQQNITNIIRNLQRIKFLNKFQQILIQTFLHYKI